MQRKYKSGAQKRKEKHLRNEAASHSNHTLYSVGFMPPSISTPSSDISLALVSCSSDGAKPMLLPETSKIEGELRPSTTIEFYCDKFGAPCMPGAPGNFPCLPLPLSGPDKDMYVSFAVFRLISEAH